MISAIVAVDNNWGIGYNGQLLEHIPDDLKYFKTLTINNIVVMGYKTWESLPRKPLPNRINIIISHSHSYNKTIENGTIFSSLSDFITNFNKSDKNIFIIGGGSIYKQLLPFCQRVYVTKIYKSYENVDTYFPNLDISEDWKPFNCSEIKEHDTIKYQFWEYDRTN